MHESNATFLYILWISVCFSGNLLSGIESSRANITRGNPRYGVGVSPLGIHSDCNTFSSQSRHFSEFTTTTAPVYRTGTFTP